MLNAMFNKVKAKGIEAIAGSDFIINKFINPRIKDYGKVIELSVKPENKQISAKVLLHGEKEPIDLHIEDYELIDDDECPSVKIISCTSNREWLTALARDFLCGKPIPVPKDNFNLVKSVL